jgi:hypothetical protein
MQLAPLYYNGAILLVQRGIEYQCAPEVDN